MAAIERLGHRFYQHPDKNDQLKICCERCGMVYEDYLDMEDTMLHHPEQPEIAEWVECGSRVVIRRRR